MTPQVKIKLTNPDAKLPIYAKEGDSGADVFSTEDVVIVAGETKLVDLGIQMELESGWECQVRSRSGLASKGIVCANSPGTIDAGYRGPCKVILHNQSGKHYEVKKGDKIAQFVFKPTHRASFEVVNELSTSDRGAGGFGSTGK